MFWVQPGVLGAARCFGCLILLLVCTYLLASGVCCPESSDVSNLFQEGTLLC